MLVTPAHWRITTPGDVSPWTDSGSTRRLRLLVDHKSTDDDAALELLAAVAVRELLEIYSTAPGAHSRVEIGEPATAGHFPVRYVLRGNAVRDMAVGPASSWRRHANQASAEHGLEVAEALRLLVLAQATARHDVDRFVCSAPLLRSGSWTRHRRDGQIGAARDATALVGLYLRANSDFTVAQEDGHATFLSQDRYYAGAAAAALPELDRWMSSAIAMWRDGQAETYSLLKGMLTRLARAIWARDQFLIRARVPRPDDCWPEALSFFEAFLLWLDGALDAMARMLHLRAGLPSESRSRAGWRRTRWTRALAEQLPPVAPLVCRGGKLNAIAEAVGAPRNFIHGEALTQELHLFDGRPEIMDYRSGALAVPTDSAQRLWAAVDHLGGHELWGLHTADEAVLLMPAHWALVALPALLDAMREVMDTIDLPGSDPLFDPSYWIPGHGHHANLLLLTGLSYTQSA